MNIKKKLVNFLFFLTILPIITQSTFAYTTNMSASIVIGQTDFSGGSTNQGGTASARTLANPYDAFIVNGKLIVSDNSNNRVLIYNSLPSTNNAAADVVIGQANFTGTSANQGITRNANTINSPQSIFSDGTRLFIAESSNNRVLIFNSIPTSNNASADVVVGQPNFTSGSSNQGGAAAANTLSNPTGVWVDGSKLFIADNTNHRVLIYNSIPTTNNAAADIVIGQTNMVNNSGNQGGSPGANTLWFPSGVFTDGGKLVIAELATGANGNKRILVFNSIPTTNNASADVVIFQPNFNSNSANQGGSAGPNTIQGTRFPWSYHGRLFVPEDVPAGNNRVLIFNTIPTTNNASADMVIGQPDFVSSAVNQGGVRAANTLNRPTGGFATEDKLVIVDRINSRVLIYDNLIKKPGISLNNAPEGRDAGLIRLKGTARADSPYVIQSVQYAINGGGFSNAVAFDGSFNSTSEDFYFDFDPNSNNYKDDGYTARVRSTTSNTDITDNLFYFQPFSSDSPSNNSYTANTLPTFSFTVNKGRFQDLKDNLSKFQVMINKENKGWQTYIETIPVSYEAIKGNGDNINKTTDNATNGNGTYEDKKIWINYSNNNSTIKVFSKGVDNTGNQTNAFFENGGKKLSSGSYQWKIVAIDKTGHSQETTTRYLRINTNQTISSQNVFPLAVLNISSLGNPDMSTTHLTAMKNVYSISSRNPTFYGIANVNSKVTLELTDKTCSEKGQADCVKKYETTTNPESRFGINLPLKALISGRSYSTRLFVSLNNDYNELPTFDLKVR